MATLTIELTEVWTEVGSAEGLAAGTAYNAVPVDGPVEAIETVSQAAPGAGARGRLLWPGAPHRPADSIDYTPAAGEYLHVRALRGRAALIVDESP